MKVKQVIPIVFFSIFLFLISCNTPPTDVISETLRKAEECMEVHPDSALLILQGIPNPEELIGKNQADYGILMTQALDKNYMPLESDSLIQLAIRYYENSDNKVAKGKAYFYYGRYLYEVDKSLESLDVLLKTRDILKGTEEHRLLGLVYDDMGIINVMQQWYDEALSNFRESLRYYTAANDSLCISIALRNIGRIYLYKDNMDSAFFYSTTALKIATDHNLKSEATILHDLSVVSRVSGDYKKAENYILDSMDKTEPDDIHSRYISLGKMYFEIGKYAEAEKYLKESLVHTTSLESFSSAYSYLYKVSYKKEDYEEMISYVEKLDSVRGLYIDTRVIKNAIELQNKYRNEQLKNENLQIRNDKNSIILLSIIIVLIASIIVIYYYLLNKNNKRRIEDIEHAINQNEQEIQSYKTELLGYNESMTEHKDEMSELKGKIALLTNQNKDLTERLIILGYEKTPLETSEFDTYIIAFRTLIAIKKGVLNRKVSDYDFTMLIKLFNFLYNNYMDRLTAEADGLTKHEIELCCLLKLGLTNRELCQASNTTLESVRKAKARLKSRLKVPEDESLESYLANY